MIKKLFLSIYINIVVWYNAKRIEKELNEEIDSALTKDTVISIIKQEKVLDEAVAKLKSEVRKQVVKAANKDYDKYLRSVDNLVDLVEDNDVQSLTVKKYWHKQFIAKEKDLKTKKDFDEMVNKRLGHFKELQKYKLERELLKEIRYYTKQGDLEKAKQLEDRWKENYARTRNNQN